MKKAALITLALIIFAFASGCRGTRTVKVYINYNEAWSCTLKVGSDLSYPNGNISKTIKLGDSVTSVSADVTKMDTGTSALTVQIIEEYEPGFLYLDSSEVVDEDTTSVVGGTVQVKYTFSENQ